MPHLPKPARPQKCPTYQLSIWYVVLPHCCGVPIIEIIQRNQSDSQIYFCSGRQRTLRRSVILWSKDLLDGFACFGCNAYLELDSFSCHKVQVKHDLFDTRRLQSSSPIVFQNAPENKQTNSKACNPLRAAAGPHLQTGFPISTTFTYLKTDNLYISSQYHFKVCFIIVCCLIFIRQKNCHESFADQEIFHRRCLAYIRKK